MSLFRRLFDNLRFYSVKNNDVVIRAYCEHYIQQLKNAHEFRGYGIPDDYDLSNLVEKLIYDLSKRNQELQKQLTNKYLFQGVHNGDFDAD